MHAVEEVPTVNQIGPEPSKTRDPSSDTESKYCLSKGEQALCLRIVEPLLHEQQYVPQYITKHVPPPNQ